MLPVLVALLLLAGCHVGFLVYMSGRSSAGPPAVAPRQDRRARIDEHRAVRVDAFLDGVLKTWGIHVFFGSAYVILILYLLAPTFAGRLPLEKLQFVAAALAPLLTVASIYFVVRQLRKNEEATWSTTVEHVHSRMHDIHRIFLADPQLRDHFYGNAAMPDCAKRRTEIAIMAELICDYFEQIVWHQRHLPGAQAKEGWTSFMVHLFEQSEVLRQHLWRQRHMYPDELREIVGVGEDGVITIRIRAHDAPWLQKGHAVLDAYFGALGEMETLEQIRQRLRDNESESTPDDARVVYEMMLLVDGEKIIAAGDYCAIASASGRPTRKRPSIGFLSHLWVDPDHQRRGLSACFHKGVEALLREVDPGGGRRAVLVAEAEAAASGDEARLRRLDYFRKRSYLPVDPVRVGYLQPDFSAHEPATGSRPVPLLLLVRDLEGPTRGRMSGAELRHIVDRLYAMYARSIPAVHIAHVRAQLQAYPDASDQIALSWEGVLPPKTED